MGKGSPKKRTQSSKVAPLPQSRRSEEREKEEEKGSHRGKAELALFVIVILFMLVGAYRDFQPPGPYLSDCLQTDSSSRVVQRLSSNARHADRNAFAVSPPLSCLLFGTNSEDALRYFNDFANLRHPSKACQEGRARTGAEKWSSGDFVAQLRQHPDSVALVDWTGGAMRAPGNNLGVLKQGLDSRCMLKDCHGVTRNAAFFIIASDLSEAEFKATPGGVDIYARANGSCKESLAQLPATWSDAKSND